MLLRTYDSASPLTDAGTLTSWLVQIGGGMIDLAGWEVLDTAECLRLLATVPIGRVIFTDHALLDVRLANFVLRNGMIVLRTGEGGKLAAVVRRGVVAFEVDENAKTETGWSVPVIGHARLVHDRGELAELSTLDLRCRASGRCEQFVVISAEMVKGRRY
jgi:hypothetical protein